MSRMTDLKVKIFADGADYEGIVKMAKNPLIKGFTTNPTLMRKAGVNDYEAFARKVLAAIPDRPEHPMGAPGQPRIGTQVCQLFRDDRTGELRQSKQQFMEQTERMKTELERSPSLKIATPGSTRRGRSTAETAASCASSRPANSGMVLMIETSITRLSGCR